MNFVNVMILIFYLFNLCEVVILICWLIRCLFIITIDNDQARRNVLINKRKVRSEAFLIV